MVLTTGEAGPACDSVARGKKVRPHAEIGWDLHVNRAGISLKFNVIVKFILIIETRSIRLKSNINLFNTTTFPNHRRTDPKQFVNIICLFVP